MENKDNIEKRKLNNTLFFYQDLNKKSPLLNKIELLDNVKIENAKSY